jgi:hypothetical protein
MISAREVRKSETAAITSCLVIPSEPAFAYRILLGFFAALQRLSDLDRPDDLALEPGLRE